MAKKEPSKKKARVRKPKEPKKADPTLKKKTRPRKPKVKEPDKKQEIQASKRQNGAKSRVKRSLR